MSFFRRRSNLFIGLLLVAFIVTLLSGGNVALACVVFASTYFIVISATPRSRQSWDDEPNKAAPFLPPFSSRAPPVA
jgi:hypothetical protein